MFNFNESTPPVPAAQKNDYSQIPQPAIHTVKVSKTISTLFSYDLMTLAEVLDFVDSD